MGFWSKVKDSFAYGLGGSLGWQAGGFIGRMVGRLVKWALVSLLGWSFISGLVDDTSAATHHRPSAAVHRVR